jgi:hypothetical protein
MAMMAMVSGTAAAAAPSIAVETVTGAQLPAALAAKGKLAQAYRWRDSDGTKFLLVSTRDTYGGNESSRYMTIIHAVCQAANCRTLRELKDSVEKCDESVTLEVDPGTVGVTDLDGNGHSEIMFAYRISCGLDDVVNDLKLILLENGAKYAIRGSEKAVVEGKSFGGATKVDPAFEKAPPAFLSHALALWARLTQPRQLPPSP